VTKPEFSDTISSNQKPPNPSFNSNKATGIGLIVISFILGFTAKALGPGIMKYILLSFDIAVFGTGFYFLNKSRSLK